MTNPEPDFTRKADSFTRKHRKAILQYRRDTEARLYQGDRVECPVCRSGFSGFAPFYPWMETNRPEAGNDRPVRCPACDALERHRFLWLFLNKHTDLFAGNKLRLIEFAPYRSFFNAFSSLPGLDYYPCDLHPDSLFYADLDGEIIRADITALTFPDQYFDVMLCSHVLEHVADDRAAIAEMHRVLRRDGWAVVQVPLDPSLAMTLEDERITSPAEREKKFGQRDHLRLYGQDFIERLKQGGFVVREYRSGILGTDAIERYGLDPDDRLFLCRPAQGGHRSRNNLFR